MDNPREGTPYETPLERTARYRERQLADARRRRNISPADLRDIAERWAAGGRGLMEEVAFAQVVAYAEWLERMREADQETLRVLGRRAYLAERVLRGDQDEPPAGALAPPAE